MPILLSELIKRFQQSPIEQFLKKLYGKEYTLNSKNLLLTKINEVWKKSGRTFYYNLIDLFCSLKELIISDIKITSSEYASLEKNLAKLENLRTIKLKNLSCKKFFVSRFLDVKNLTYFKISDLTLDEYQLARLSKNIKSSNIEKLTIKNIQIISF